MSAGNRLEIAFSFEERVGTDLLGVVVLAAVTADLGERKELQFP